MNTHAPENNKNKNNIRLRSYITRRLYGDSGTFSCYRSVKSYCTINQTLSTHSRWCVIASVCASTELLFSCTCYASNVHSTGLCNRLRYPSFLCQGLMLTKAACSTKTFSNSLRLRTQREVTRKHFAFVLSHFEDIVLLFFCAIS